MAAIAACNVGVGSPQLICRRGVRPISASRAARPVQDVRRLTVKAQVQQRPQEALLPAAALTSAPLLSLLAALPAAADEGVPSPPPNPLSFFSTLSPAGLLLVTSPILLYGVFNVYRSQVNTKAKWSDFVFICAALALGGNLISILVFKVRFF